MKLFFLNKPLFPQWVSNFFKSTTLAASVSFLLVIIKLALYYLSGSLIIGLSAYDSVIDVIMSLIHGKILTFARSGADDDHPYGHGKAESLAALGQGILIAGGAVMILHSSLVSLFTKQYLKNNNPSYTLFILCFLIASGIVAHFLYRYLKKQGSLKKSPALLADAKHYQMDVYTNFTSAFSLLLIFFTSIKALDPIVAGLGSIYIGFEGYDLIKMSLNDLMDSHADAETKNQILAWILKHHPEILDIHKFRSRKSGSRYFFDFHVTLPKTLSFIEVHNIIESIELNLEKNFEADVVVHADPYPES